MKKFNGYENVKTISTQDRLPTGGYILEIKNVEEKVYDWGDVLLFSFDVSEGDYKGYYAENYQSQTTEDKKWKGTYRLNIPKDDGSEADERTKRSFKTTMVAIEESNPGYTWDWNETNLKGKKIGGVFRNREYEFNGNHGFFTECAWFTSVEAIQAGKFKVPADRLLKTKTPSIDVSVDAIDDEDLPF